ncbi:hypothetical protein F5X97DRAFT_233325 [Nemania serpens]|nr:hypothetical protein F5X97DRAFT_233325 [Nemania serpens]
MESATERLVRLQLDVETGEMLSKNELKKQQQTRANKSARPTSMPCSSAAF